MFVKAKALVLGALGMLLAVPAVSHAAPPPRPNEILLGAGATHGPDIDGFSGSLNFAYGYFFTNELELSLRQSISYTDIGGAVGEGSVWSASTRVAADYHFVLGDRGQFRPFIGANFGYVYGEGQNDTFAAAPEAGIKIDVTDTAFIFVLAEYQFFFDKGSDAGDSFSDGQFLYSAGVGFRF
jgi:hypothetical protein